jgi:hypothetical protein
MPGRVQKFFTLLGLLKYGLILSLLSIYLPLTAVFTDAPGHDITGNMFVELPAVGVFIATIFLLAVAWSVMFTEGLIVNGSENRFDKTKAPYRKLRQLQEQPSEHIPAWADFFFSIPVTRWQFVGFTAVLAAPSLVVFIVWADHPLLALFVALAAFVIAYIVSIVLATPAALVDPSDPPLRGFPLAESVWSWFGFPLGGKPSAAMKAARGADRLFSWVVKKLRLSYLIDPKTGLAYPAHFLATFIVVVLTALWIGFDWIAYPGRFGIESAPVVYVYASLLLFVWLFAALNFHLGRLRISSIAALLIFVLLGYGIFDVDHHYDVRREESRFPLLTPVETVKDGKGGENLVVIASAGGGIWAAGWTTLALEKLVAQRPELIREIRLLSTVSGGSVGAAHFVYGLLNDQQYQKQGKLGPETLRDIRVKAVSSSLEAAAYGVAFRDFPRLITGGIYHPTLDRGYLLEREWARIAAGTVAASVENGVKREYLAGKGSDAAGKCWDGQHKCGFLDLREAIAAGSIPSVIFNATVMELGRRIMITPLDFEPNGEGRERGETLPDFLFSDGSSRAASAQANLPLWTAARLSATFSFVSPAVRTNVANKRREEKDRNVWRQHLVDGGYYDNYGVASALDWLRPVLEARREGKGGLNFSRVLIVQLRAFAETPEEKFPPSPGAKAALVGPLDAVFAIRQGVAISRNLIDVDRFVTYWNGELAGKVKVESVDFVPDMKETAGPLSWHLSKADIKGLKESWGDDDAPAGWKPGIQQSWCKLASFLGQAVGAECAAA